MIVDAWEGADESVCRLVFNPVQVLGYLGEGRLHPIVHDRVALADAAVALKQVRRLGYEFSFSFRSLVALLRFSLW